MNPAIGFLIMGVCLMLMVIGITIYRTPKWNVGDTWCSMFCWIGIVGYRAAVGFMYGAKALRL